MNTIRAIGYMAIRGYRKRVRRRPDVLGIRGTLEMAEETDTQQVRLDLEDIDPDDTAALESDFSRAHEYYDMHQGEVAKRRAKLQQDIIARKYFKTVEPSFLTLAEREEIKNLHRDDPEEWTAERLSHSFPISPEGVRKILKDKWRPKSIERAVAYDKKIAQNWKEFHAGKITVSPTLRKHLSKFGKRQIDLKDRETLLERFVEQKMKFPDPKTKVFSTILDYIEDSQNTEQQSRIPLQGGSAPVTEATDTAVAIRTQSNNPLEEIKKKKKASPGERLTFTEFAEEKYVEVSKKCQQEGEVLLDTYKKHIKSTSEKIAEKTESTTESNTVMEQPRKKEGQLTTPTLGDRPALAAIEDKENYALSTYVKKWEKLHDLEPTYYDPIKIPKGAYRKGKVYRIGDCYYADDGEFLYRVPGLRS